MAWRFKASKYKNAVPKFNRKEEWITELPIGNLPQCQGNHIKASAVYMAFNIEYTGGGSLGILPLACKGRQGKKVPYLHAHADIVTDFDFSPFDDHLLATGSCDTTIKVWLLPEDSSFESESNAVLTIGGNDRRIENILWHPTADGVIAASVNTAVKIYDVCNGKEKYVFEDHSELIQSISWRGDGSTIATSCKDKKIRVLDPRSSSVTMETNGHQNIKDSRVLWLGNKDVILSTGYDSTRTRCIGIWDTRNFTTPVHSVNLDNSVGVLMPFYDPDTDMVFIIGKGDNLIRFLELSDKNILTEASVDRCEQMKGMCRVPKRAMSVMNGEVNRLLCLVDNAVIPAAYIVPRKSYRDYHADLYPNTNSVIPAMTAEQWFSGDNTQMSLINLNPSKKEAVCSRRGELIKGVNSSLVSAHPSATLPVDIPSTTQEAEEVLSSSPNVKDVVNKFQQIAAVPTPELTQSQPESTPHANGPPPNTETPESCLEKETQSKEEQVQNSDVKDASFKPTEVPHADDCSGDVPRPAFKPATIFTGVKNSKFRHLKGQVLHRDRFIENLRNVSSTVPGESDMFAANLQRCAVPLEGPGGLILILELEKAGRLPDTGLPCINNGSKVMDFVWDPFDNKRLVVVCDDAKIRVWNIPEGGLTESVQEADMYLKGHTEKIYFVRFHPLARDIIISASYDMTVRIWDLAKGEEVIRLDDHPEAVFCMAWHPEGNIMATACKDGKVRIFDPRQGTAAIRTGESSQGSRGARMVWTLGGKYIFVSGFEKRGSREIVLVDSSSMQVLMRESLDTSPSIHVPFYDPDICVIFLQGRGDRQILAYEIREDEPHVFPLAGFTTADQSQAVSFLTKNACDARKVEFAFAWRLTKSTVEPVSFTVPRIKTEFFQDDLFPDTRVVWEPVLTSAEWLSGATARQKEISMRPDDMQPLSEAPVEAVKPKKFASYNVETYKTDDQKKDELISAMDKKLMLSDAPLPQDLTEGVDDDEWDD